jgi:cytochrome c2
MLAISGLRGLASAAILSGVMTHAGGWAVITLDNVPDYAVAGKPIELTYTVRQHGHTLLDDLHGTIEARSGRTAVDASARRVANAGRYATTLVLPSAGEWTITIKSGFGNSNVTLLPLTVVAEGRSLTRATSAKEGGERLFTSKGCVTCHVQMQAGPNLEGKRFDPIYIARFLADPSIAPPQPNGSKMPDLGLQQQEIASLVTYLNSDRQVSAR